MHFVSTQLQINTNVKLIRWKHYALYHPVCGTIIDQLVDCFINVLLTY